MKKTFQKTVGLLIGLIVAGTAWGQVKVEGGWARATVQGQKATGAFVTLTAAQNTQLVSASSPAAGITEIHEMAMDGNVMKMRAIPALDLPAGKAIELKPGGYHIMLMDLKAPLVKGASLALTLTFKDAKGQQNQQQVILPVSTGPAMQHGHGDHKH